METTGYLESRAAAGDADAMFRLGYRIAFGRSRRRPTDWSAALECWRAAAELGHRRAACEIAVCYELGRGLPVEPAEALRWYRISAERGYPPARYYLGLFYREGLFGLPVDPAAAVTWFRAAAMYRNRDACRDLGYCLHEGVGTAVDFEEAVLWYRRASRMGDAKAQWNLALCYLDGDGVPVSRRSARIWLERAAANGHRPARRKLRELFGVSAKPETPATTDQSPVLRPSGEAITGLEPRLPKRRRGRTSPHAR
jgi:TPR repeat protein